MWSTPIHSGHTYVSPEDRYRQFLMMYYQLELDDFKYNIREWKTTSTSGYWMSPHNHGHSHFTSIYYKHVSGEGGDLILHDPRANANRGYPQEFAIDFKPMVIKPLSGLYIIFPSYVYHTAAPFQGAVREAHVSELQLFSETTGTSEQGATPI